MRLLGQILLGVGLLVVAVVVIMHFRARSERSHEEAVLAKRPKTLTLTSGSFPPGGDMPINCTCKGREVSPALRWENVPNRATSFVVLATDYDVPTPAFPVFNLTHWMVYNLPASVRSLPEAVTPEQMRMLGGKTGKNSTGSLKYIGPCPPIGRHAYVFRVFALDSTLSFRDLPDRSELMDAMNRHILSYGELTGYFQ